MPENDGRWSDERATHAAQIRAAVNPWGTPFGNTDVRTGRRIFPTTVEQMFDRGVWRTEFISGSKRLAVYKEIVGMLFANGYLITRIAPMTLVTEGGHPPGRAILFTPETDFPNPMLIDIHEQIIEPYTHYSRIDLLQINICRKLNQERTWASYIVGNEAPINFLMKAITGNCEFIKQWKNAREVSPTADYWVELENGSRQYNGFYPV